MTDDLIQRLLGGGEVDPETGQRLDLPIRAVAIRPSLDGDEAELVRALDLGRTLAVVADPITEEVLGGRVRRALRTVATVEDVILPGRPHADIETVRRLQAATAGCSALVAVGSGTLTDLCKYAAHLDGKPFAVFSTAPSMNGYASASAAITVDGHKSSLPAATARGVFMELSVLARAPLRMIRSGLGDSLCRSTAQVDWLLAHLLLGQPYRLLPYRLLEAEEPLLLEAPDALVGGDMAAMAALARTLVLSGFGMTLAGSSAPASQGEHLISHYAEMMGDPLWPPVFHGEQIAVATLAMARLQERMLAGGAPVLCPSTVDEAALTLHFGPHLGRSAWRAFQPKRLDAARAEALTARLASGWEAMRERIDAIRVPAARLEAALARAGAPLLPGDLGWPEEFWRGAVRHARLIRDRFGFLDLAAESGRDLVELTRP